MQDSERVRIKWTVVQESGDSGHLAGGSAAAILSAILSALSIGAYVMCSAATLVCLEDRRVFVGVVICLFIITIGCGFVVHRGIKRIHAGLRSTVPPFFTRFGLWVGFFLVTGIMIRFAMRAAEVWSTLNLFQAYVACMALGLMALGVVQFQLLLRLPEIRRTVDAEEGAIL